MNARRPAAKDSPTGARPQCVLVVDDEVMHRRIMQAVLEALGHEVVTAGTAEDGLEVLDHRSVDLVIVDRRLPWANGEYLIDGIRRQAHLLGLPILLVSAFDQPAKHLADAFVRKPFELEHFEQTVRRLIGDTRPA